jgi:hypothetical protein
MHRPKNNDNYNYENYKGEEEIQNKSRDYRESKRELYVSNGNKIQ